MDKTKKKIRFVLCICGGSYRHFPACFLLIQSFVIGGIMGSDLVLKNNLREVRSGKGLSQGELAKLVGVSRQTICSIENGQFNPTAKLALILCIALDQKFEELFYF